MVKHNLKYFCLECGSELLAKHLSMDWKHNHKNALNVDIHYFLVQLRRSCQQGMTKKLKLITVKYLLNLSSK
jgi:hypothetical protein